MAKLKELIVILFSINVTSVISWNLLDNDTLICKGKERLKQVRLQNECSKEIFVETSVEILPTSHQFSILKNCLNCSLTLRTSEDRRLTAILYSLATETGPNGECDLNRLDIYDGDQVSEDSRLTNDSGICGCDLHAYRGFKTTNNTMTLVFYTKCGTATQHGEFDLVVSSVKKEMFDWRKYHCAGFFECRDGQCIDKNLVCDGLFHCKDHSDENGCLARNGTCNNRFQCKNGQCINKNLVCDGEFNCVDHSDEANCTRMRNGSCPGLFECETNRKCISKNLVCDGNNNCGDSSDEKGCSFYQRLPRLLLYALVALACLCLVVFIIIVIILCWRYCTKAGQVASTYRRLT